MFRSGLILRIQSFCPNYARYSETKNNLTSVFLLGGGLGKLQGGIKEEEYFTSISHGLMTNIHKNIETSKTADYLRKWEEYERTVNHAAFYNTTCINKYKDAHEEAFFLNESTECLKAMLKRNKDEGKED